MSPVRLQYRNSSRKALINRFMLATAFILCFQACATLDSDTQDHSDQSKSHYTVYVDTISEPSYSAKKFVIISGNKAIQEDDLQFREFSKIVSNVLTLKGFVQVSDLKNADHMVALNYSVSEPQQITRSRMVPVPRGPGGTNTVMRDRFGNSLGSFETQPSPFGGFDVQAVAENDTLYLRRIFITAFEFKKEKGNRKIAKDSLRTLWQAKISSAGSTGNLRKLFPVMMFAAQRFIGGNSRDQKEINLYINDDDQRVQSLSETQQQPQTK